MFFDSSFFFRVILYGSCFHDYFVSPQTHHRPERFFEQVDVLLHPHWSDYISLYHQFSLIPLKPHQDRI